MKRFLCDGTTRLSWDGKQFITIEPTRIHTRDGRCPERKPALHHPSDRGRDQLFSRASGVAALDAIRTHSDFASDLA